METLWIEPRTNSWRTCARGLKNICSESYIQSGRRLGDGKVSFYALATPSSPGPAIRCWKCSDFGVISTNHNIVSSRYHTWMRTPEQPLFSFGIFWSLRAPIHSASTRSFCDSQKMQRMLVRLPLTSPKTSKIKASTNSTSHKLVFRNPGNIHQLYSDK